MTVQTHDEEARLARVAFFKSKLGLIEHKAHEQAKADRSDPFTYARVRSHYQNGLPMSPDEYSVEWGKELKTTIVNGVKVEYPISVPRNIKRP